MESISTLVSRHYQQEEGALVYLPHLRTMCPVKCGHLYQAEERARSPALLTLHHLINIYTRQQQNVRELLPGPRGIRTQLYLLHIY